MIKVEFFMKGEPGPKVREFASRYEAERFHAAMHADPNCECVHIVRNR